MNKFLLRALIIFALSCNSNEKNTTGNIKYNTLSDSSLWRLVKIKYQNGEVEAEPNVGILNFFHDSLFFQIKDSIVVSSKFIIKKQVYTEKRIEILLLNSIRYCVYKGDSILVLYEDCSEDNPMYYFVR